MSHLVEPLPEPLHQAEYYHNDVFGSQILVRLLERHLGGRVLEVGAGAGYITLELARRCKFVVALEPSPTLFAELVQRTKDIPNIAVHNATLEEFRISCKSQPPTSAVARFDSVVYINVLEHIKDDVAEIRRACTFLSAVGNVLIVVPAHQWLYAKIDRLTGHFRRYSKKELSNCLRSADLDIGWVRYFDSVGLLPYLIIYKWCRSTAVSGTNAVAYSRLILPFSELLYRLTRGSLVGKNLLAVAQQPRA